MSAAHQPEPSPGQIDALRQALLRWYATAARELPWRASKDAYGIWVSEIMCQQTQVATVKAYWTRWMTRFPDVQALASAPEEEVMGLWAGLGYYRRARFLHKAAKEVAQHLGGVLPAEAKGLLRLPGIGRYTAGAIASIAYGEVVPLVDGNVERVFARLWAIAGDPKDRQNQKVFWSLASELVDPGNPGDFNQALMELGATVCTPKSPTCMLCPLRVHCEAFALGKQAEFPAKVKRKKPRPVSLASLWIKGIGADASPRYLLRRREHEGLWGGLWEAPSSEPVGSQEEALEKLVESLGQWGVGPLVLEHGGEVSSWQVLGEFEHTLSHMKMGVRVYGVTLEPGSPLGRCPRRGRGAGWRQKRWREWGSLWQVRRGGGV